MHDNDTTTDDRMSALFHESTDRLDPDVTGLVRGGIDRSRVRRRRTAIGTTLAAVATVGAVGAVASVVPDLGSNADPAGSPAVIPATSATTSSAASSAGRPATAPRTTPTYDKATMTPPAVPVADLPVRAAELPRRFAQLYPGKISPADARTGRIIADGRRNQIAHFRWNGYLVSVVFSAYAGTPAQGCRELSGEQPNCRVRPDGSVLANGRETGDHEGGGTYAVNYSYLYTEDHYMVAVLAYNYAAKLSPVLSDDPPLTVQQVTKAATSPIWY